jgi:acetoin utilization deacetylase AcuC-like enzyme
MSLRTPMVWSDACLLHDPKGEVWVGVTFESTEIAARAEVIRSALGLPTVAVQEGGYHLPSLGGLVVATITGLETRG